jgi:hypothetical protein
MSLGSEEDVKKALGIKSFRELSKEKVLALAASMPEMANEVRLKLIEQIPAVQKFALDAVNAVERTFSKTIDSDDESGKRLQESFSDIRKVIQGELDRDDISEEHRRFLMKKLLDTSKTESEKDTESKKFRAEQAAETRNSVLMIVGLAVLTAILFAGGKVIATRGCTEV